MLYSNFDTEIKVYSNKTNDERIRFNQTKQYL